MAEIWLARQSGMKGFEKMVVVKRMMASIEADPDHVEMFLTEARLAAQLNHPNVVQIYELGEEAGSYYIAMEYLDGENLAMVRRTGNTNRVTLPDTLAARMVAWAAEGLHYAHTRVGLDGKPMNIVHRDVSPQNLIVTYGGALKVVDFGIAKLASQATMSGKLKGKLAYMSPEQARAQPADARSDVFALGIVLFELVTRTRLLPKMDDLEILNVMAGSTPLPRPTERREDVPSGLDLIIVKAMARKREERFQSAREMQEALESWLRATGESATSNDVADYMQALFAERITERRQLIEAAMSADPSGKTAHTLQELVRVTEPGSGTSRSQARVAESIVRAQATRRTGLYIGAAVAGVVLLSGVLYAVTRPDPQPVKDPPVVVPPKPAPPVLAVDTVPTGAAITVDGTPRGKAPLVLDALGVGEHLVVASLDGHRDSTRTVKLSREGERLEVQLALATVVAPPQDPVVKDPPPKDPVRRDPPPRAQKGKLTLKTEPWTQVFLGRQKLGDTPLIGVALPVGRHVLRLYNPESGLESSIEVDIKPNDTTVKKLKL